MQLFRRSDTPPAPRRRDHDHDRDPAPQTGDQFRRGRTLSSYRAVPADDSPRNRSHHLVRTRRRIGGLLTLVVGSIVLLGLLTWQLVAQVHVGNSSRPVSTAFDGRPYEAAINDYYALHPAERLRFLLNRPALSAFVSSELPEVAGIEYGGSAGIGQADFTVTFRSPVAGWQINGIQYYVDQSGVVFRTNVYEAPAVQIVDESGVRPEQGSTVVGSRLLAFLGRVVAGAGERGYTVTRAVLPQGTTREVEIETAGTSTRVKFSIDRGAGEQVEDMDRALSFLRERSITAAYIDIRVSGRAAYK